MEPAASFIESCREEPGRSHLVALFLENDNRRKEGGNEREEHDGYRSSDKLEGRNLSNARHRHDDAGDRGHRARDAARELNGNSHRHRAPGNRLRSLRQKGRKGKEGRVARTRHECGERHDEEHGKEHRDAARTLHLRDALENRVDAARTLQAFGEDFRADDEKNGRGKEALRKLPGKRYL